jgi:hypothetical protein
LYFSITFGLFMMGILLILNEALPEETVRNLDLIVSKIKLVFRISRLYSILMQFVSIISFILIASIVSCGVWDRAKE